MNTININSDKCILCGTCEEVCVRRIFSLAENALTLTEPESCILCGHCKAACPEDAIEIPALDPSEFLPVPQKDEIPAPAMLMNLFRVRRSTRIYKDMPVEREKLEQIIQAARFAPTGGNLQALRYVVVHTPEKVKAVRGLTIKALTQYGKTLEKAMENAPEDQKAAMTGNRMVNYLQMFKRAEADYEKGMDRILWDAPALIVTHVSNLVENPGVDVGLAGMQMALMAESLGLGSCFIGLLIMAATYSRELRGELMIPENHKTVTSLVCGYPDITYQTLVGRNKEKVRWL
ncbi:MAG: nitroreductase family protein [Proteobacteria bacterium]|nr:nitroreductase family protein [Pseudomonadota bacterium]MBU4470506.1 nitroreductase family protein [Pseudomonadota bacterium]MCG2751827.1 nitroreductase family protein [Desulfobacteraceae bacterium]